MIKKEIIPRIQQDYKKNNNICKNLNPLSKQIKNTKKS